MKTVPSACTQLRAWVLEKYNVDKENPEWVTWFECFDRINTAGTDIPDLVALHKSKAISDRLSGIIVNIFCQCLMDDHVKLADETCKLCRKEQDVFQVDFLREVSEVLFAINILVLSAEKELLSVPNCRSEMK